MKKKKTVNLSETNYKKVNRMNSMGPLDRLIFGDIVFSEHNKMNHIKWQNKNTKNWNISLASFDGPKTTNEMCRISSEWTHARLNRDYLNSIITGMFPAVFFFLLLSLSLSLCVPLFLCVFIHWRKENKHRVAETVPTPLGWFWPIFFLFPIQYSILNYTSIQLLLKEKKNASCNLISKKWMPWTLNAIAT